MASAKAEVKLSLEKAVHNALRDTAQELWDKHGILVKSVNFSWDSISTVEGDKFLLSQTTVETTTKRR